MWHPATLLLMWCGFALVLQGIALAPLLGLSCLCLMLSWLYARARSRKLIWRARWLLVSLALLFGLLTPGEYLPGIWGVLGLTYEGLRHAGEQLARLVAMLASLALLHEKVGTSGILTGLYVLLAPFPFRVPTVVRLLLVLDFVEQRQEKSWRDWLEPVSENSEHAESIRLNVPRLRLVDTLVIGGSILFVAIMAL